MPNANRNVTSVTACFPCFNDAMTIATMVRDVRGALVPLVDDLEIIVVDDGSADDSVAVLRKMQTEIPELKVVIHGTNRGYGMALISAFGAATKDWIFYTDGDGQYDATESALMIQAVRDDTDIVQGYKIGRGDNIGRRIIGRAYHHLVKTLFRLPVRDTDCDFRLFRRRLVIAHPLSSTSGVICVEMMHTFRSAGARFIEVPVHHYFRPHGRSQFFRLPQLTRAGLGLVSLWWRVTVRGQGAARTG
jgi:glycosyltransferase involved in cell wall biosynthesis